MEKLLNSLELYLDGKAVTQTEKGHFLRFIRQLKSSRRARFIYRGDSNIFEQSNIEPANLALLAQSLFCLGNKAMYFFQKKFFERDSIFSLLWEKFHNKVCKLNFESVATKERVSAFLQNNPIFNYYFSDEHNKDHFESLLKLPAAKAKKVADYYLSLLHTVGKSGNGKSYFLSSSTNYLVADIFKGDRKIIVYGWLPRKGIKDCIIECTDSVKRIQFVKSLNLPTYQTSIYPKQSEVCIKCGLLPHYIIGFQQNNKFYINPNTLKPWNNNIVYDGLDIDQRDFNDLSIAAKLTQSYFLYDGIYYVNYENRLEEI